MKRRWLRHHLPLALIAFGGSAIVGAVMPFVQPLVTWSMATAYVGMALLVVTLAIGPLNVLRRKANPVSTDLRRDIAIWAGVVSLVHFIVGWQIHMKRRYEYFLYPTMLPRTDLFGFANDTGLLAVLIILLLLALSNDRTMRSLGTKRWKGLQRWNYAAMVFVIAHSIAFQVIEKQMVLLVVLFAILCLTAIAIQALGYRARRGS